MEYNWVLRGSEKIDTQDYLRDGLDHLPTPLARALINRGISSSEAAKNFFSPCLSQLSDPFLMKDMDLAVDRIMKAIDNRERILVYGDYDVDGTTSTTMLLLFLRQMGADVLYFIPHRYRDGCGLKKIGVDFALNSKARLIITIDCGIGAHKEADYAKEKGIDLIVCDHHNPGKELPEAVAILDPKRSDCNYPFKDLSGCGVGFKLIQGVLKAMDKEPSIAYQFLDLVALSIASDIVSVSGENRILLREGLELIRKSPRTSLCVLAQQAKLDLKRCTVGQIVFSIGPRINAAGRMGDARAAVELLKTKDRDYAMSIAQKLEGVNLERRELDKQTFAEACEMVKIGPPLDEISAIVLFKEDWHLGVIGIVASRLVERYRKPVILISTVDGEAKGSARSLPGFDIYSAIRDSPIELIRFGGHEYAAGLSLHIKDVDRFMADFQSRAREQVVSQAMKPEIKVDTAIGLSDITPEFWNHLGQFGPFGPGNKKVVFLGNKFRVCGFPTLVGSGHLRFKVLDEKSSDCTRSYDVIGYNMKAKLPIVKTSAEHGSPISLVFTIEENHHGGRKSIQLCLKDVKLSCDAQEVLGNW